MKSCFGLTDLTGIAHITSLEVLNLSDCWQIHVDQLDCLSSLSNLEELDLSGCRNIYNESGRGIPRPIPHEASRQFVSAPLRAAL